MGKREKVRQGKKQRDRYASTAENKVVIFENQAEKVFICLSPLILYFSIF